MQLSLASSLTLASSALVAASSLEARADTVTLTTTEYDNMMFYVQYAAAAYCDSTEAVGSLVTCVDNVDDGCPDVMADNVTILGTVPSDTLFNLEAYVALDTVREEIVLAFRGSSSLRNWIADFDFILVSYDYCDGCYVHDGFYTSWNEVKSYAQDIVEAAFETYPDYTFVVTGHSLGAAVATLAGTEFRTEGYPCDIYTVGSPRVGNLAFAEFVTAQTGAEYRATHYDDPVPRLPPIVLDYFHTSPEYWLAAGPSTNTDYTISDIDICVGYANTSCNAGTSGLDGTAHEYYFQYMGCGDDDDSNGITLRGTPESQLWVRQSSDNITDAELAEKLTNYTNQDIAYSKELEANGTAQWS